MKTLQIYECSDGKRFDDKNKAEKHEQLISDCQILINSVTNGRPLKFAEFRLHDKEFIKRKREELTYIYKKYDLFAYYFTGDGYEEYSTKTLQGLMSIATIRNIRCLMEVCDLFNCINKDGVETFMPYEYCFLTKDWKQVK